MRTRFVILLAFLAAATPLFAIRSRPLSPVVYADRAPMIVAGAASDGRDFLVIGSSALNPSGADTHVVVQQIVNGAPAARQLAITGGAAIGVVWTGTHYLAAWNDAGGIFVAPLTPEGHLLAMPAQPVMKLPSKAFFAANEHGALLIGDSMQMLDTNGVPVGPPKPLPPAPVTDVAASGDGFVLGLGRWWRGVGVVRIGSDGTSQAPVIVDSAGNNSVVSAAGDSTVVLYDVAVSGGGTVLKAAVVDANGSVHAPQTVYEPPQPANAMAVKMVWDGAECVAVVGVADLFDQTELPALIRISSSGGRIGELHPLVSNDDWQVPVALATNGREALPAWYEFRSPDGLVGSRVAAVPLTMASIPAGRYLGRAADAQSEVAVASMGSRSLAAWLETTADARTVRVSRIESGVYLDGEGIVLATTDKTRLYGFGAHVSVAAGPDGWLVVWVERPYAIRGVRIAADGRLLDGEPISIDQGYGAVVCWNGTSYIVAGSDGGLRTAVVSRDGVASPGRIIAQGSYAYAPDGSSDDVQLLAPALAVCNGKVVVAFTRRHLFSTGTVGHDEASFFGLRLDSAGAAIDAAPFPIGDGGSYNYGGGAAIAADGSRYLVVWPNGSNLNAAFLSGDAPQKGGSPFVVNAAAMAPAVSFDGDDFLVAWRGTSSGALATAHVHGTSVSPPAVMPLDPGEYVNQIAVSGRLIGCDFVNEAYGVMRGGLLLDPIDAVPPNPPAPPRITSAARVDPDTVVAAWQPVAGVFGTLLELGFADGTWCEIGEAPCCGGTIAASLAGLNGIAVRLRSWSAAGTSAPSDERLIVPHRGRVVAH